MSYVNGGKNFQFPADFVVVDFEPDPRVPLILGRCFLKTSHALIDVYEGEITLRVGKEAITFNLDQTSKYTADYNHMTVNKIDVIDMALYFHINVKGRSRFIFLLREDRSKLQSEDDPNFIRILEGYPAARGNFEQDFSKLPVPMDSFGLKEDTPFFFSEECIDSLIHSKKKLTEGSDLIAPDSGTLKTMTMAQTHYTPTEKELLDRKDSKARLMAVDLYCSNEFDIEITETKNELDNLAAYHLFQT
ncbi:reverse transcriptase domain-containing protein [Tanacetum coccineum]